MLLRDCKTKWNSQIPQVDPQKESALGFAFGKQGVQRCSFGELLITQSNGEEHQNRYIETVKLDIQLV